jgi:hypothetical protein
VGRRIPWRNIGMERGSQTLAYPKSWPCNFDCILIQLIFSGINPKQVSLSGSRRSYFFVTVR